MARTITIIIDEDPQDEGSHLQEDRYADIGNGIWAFVQAALPGRGFHLKADNSALTDDLNKRWEQHGRDYPWQ